MTTPLIPAYSAELFKDRDEEIQFINGMLTKISKGGREPGQANVITLRGERGTGKTWMALHLKRTILSKNPAVKPLLISLVSTFDPESYQPQGPELLEDELFVMLDKSPAPTPDDFCVKTLRWVAKNLGATTTEQAGADELSNWLVRDIKQNLSYKVIVLILDSVFETDWAYLKKLEEYLLVPLAALPNTLLIMTGRGISYPWTSPYLRITEEKHLGAFEDKVSREQIKSQVLAENTVQSFEKVKEISGGYPLVNVLMVQSRNLKFTLDEIANLLLDIKSTKYRPEIRDYFEALSVLDGFDEDEISGMLAAYYDDDKYENWTDQQKRDVKQKMLDTHLVRWENGKYLMDESVRRVLEEYLKLDKESGRWMRLHQGATKLYEDWAKRFPKHAGFFSSKAGKHIVALEEISPAPQKVSRAPTSSKAKKQTGKSYKTRNTN